MKLLFAALMIWLLPAAGQSASVTFARHEYHYFPYLAYVDFGDVGGSQAAAAAYANSLTECGVRGHLADLTTREEFQAITASGIVTGHNVWIGLTYSESEGKYIWTTGQPLSTVPNNDNWNSPTEPNGVLIGENCVIIESSTGKWYDTVCSTPGYDVLVEFDCPYPSPAAIRVISGHRYEYYTTASLSLSWEAAVVACAQMVRCGVYGHLVTLTTKTEQDAVKLAFQSQFSSDTKASWVGLSDTIDEGIFLWVNGETYVKDDPNNAVFVTGEPNDYDGFPPGEDCVSQRLSDSLLNDQLCGDAITQGGICEFDVDCPTEAPSAFPSLSPSRLPSSSPSLHPSRLPSRRPSNFPSRTPSWRPSRVPSQTPSRIPSRTPSKNPSRAPSQRPSRIPSRTPSRNPSRAPSQRPSRIPSRTPSRHPSRAPSQRPSRIPSRTPSRHPSRVPSRIPSRIPSRTPSKQPSKKPSSSPSLTPSVSPSVKPSAGPTSIPSQVPSMLPSVNPSSLPSSLPSLMPSFRYEYNVKKCIRFVFKRWCTCEQDGKECLTTTRVRNCIRRYEKKNRINERDEMETFKRKLNIAFNRECRRRRRRGIE